MLKKHLKIQNKIIKKLENEILVIKEKNFPKLAAPFSL